MNIKTLLFAFLLSNTLFVYGQGKRVLFIGDSITDGWWGGNNGASSKDRNHNDMNHIYGHGYMMICAAHFQSKEPKEDYAFFNRGVSGNTLKDLENRWKEDVLDLKPDVLTVLIGTNDVGNFLKSLEKQPMATFDYNDWEMRYRHLLDKVKKNNPKVRIVLCAPFVQEGGRAGTASAFELRNKITRRLSTIVEYIAKDINATFLPFDKMFDRLVKNQLRPFYWIWDGIHPTMAGHERMADMWIAKVKIRR